LVVELFAMRPQHLPKQGAGSTNTDLWLQRKEEIGEAREDEINFGSRSFVFDVFALIAWPHLPILALLPS